MQCCVVTTLTFLCLTGHVPTHAGHAHAHTQGHLDTDESETLENSTLPSFVVDGRGSFDFNDRRRNASQSSLQEEDAILETLQEDTVTPVVFDHLVFPEDHRDHAVITPQVDIISTHQEMSSTTKENIIITTTDNNKINDSFHESISSTHQTNISTTPHGHKHIIPLENITTNEPNGTTTVPHKDFNATYPQTDITTRQTDMTTPQTDIPTLQEDMTTLQTDMVTSPGSGSEDQVKTTVLDPVLEDGQVPPRVDQLVLCSCPEMTPDGCRRLLSDVTIASKSRQFRDIRIPVEDLNVVVHNVTCLKKDHRLRNFSEGQFYYRERGDLVLTDAGYLAGLRVSDYCADLRQDKNQEMKWNIKICIPPPSVPKCCPYGQALKNGVCKEAATPAILAPPLSAGLKEKSIYWPVIRNHYNPLNCTVDPIRSIPLVPLQSYLLSLPDGILHVWHPADGHVPWKYTFPPDLCIDGYVDTYGSVVYSANICYSHPEELHREVCDGHICVRKCCPYGEEMSVTRYRCVPSNTTSYTPLFTATPSDYRVVHGDPLCTYKTMVDSATVDSRGRYHYKDTPLSAKDYCVDKFTDEREMREDRAKVCIRNPSKAWIKARKIAFPICHMISVLFLLLTVGCYCVVPRLLQGGGWYHLFHVLSLMLGYTTMFAHTMFTNTWEETTCLIMGIVLQFSFLATFFWLNILCFDVWRKIRSLDKYRPATVIPIWIYILYGYGLPITIGILTVCIHFFAPEDVPGLVKPNLAQSRCFFPNLVTLFLYFYGPIALLFASNIFFVTHTYWTYRSFEQNSSKLREKSQETNTNRIPNEHIHRKRDYVSDFKQQFCLLVLMSTCWVSEILSSVIPPIEMWALTDLLNTLQGFFIFLIFLANRSKRRHLKKKFPKLFKVAHQLKNVIGQCCCPSDKGTCLPSVNNLSYQISKKLSSSSFASSLSTLSTSLKTSTSSFYVTSPDDKHDMKRPSVIEADNGVKILSRSSIKSNSTFPSENSDSQC